MMHPMQAPEQGYLMHQVVRKERDESAREKVAKNKQNERHRKLVEQPNASFLRPHGNTEERYRQQSHYRDVERGQNEIREPALLSMNRSGALGREQLGQTEHKEQNEKQRHLQIVGVLGDPLVNHRAFFLELFISYRHFFAVRIR